MSRKLKVFTCIMLIISIMSSLTVSSVALNEEEPANNEESTPTRITNDTNNYGYISTSGDEDWWVISFGNTEGFANFYLGSLPEDYDMEIYCNGKKIAICEEFYTANELFRIRVYKQTDYKIRVYGGSSSDYDPNDSYKLRCKVYALKPTRIFTVDSNNNWIAEFSGISPTNTRQDATNIMSSLWSMGYTATEYENNSANAAASVYSTSDIIVVSTHGGPGKIGYNNSVLYANYNHPSYTTDRSIYANAGDASELDLVIYSTCESGAPSSTYGNLVDVTLSKGAYACLGWKGEIGVDPSTDWLDKLFDELATGRTLERAMEIADNYVKREHGTIEFHKIEDRYCGSTALGKLIIGGY